MEVNDQLRARDGLPSMEDLFVLCGQKFGVWMGY
jgi:hypothetical protein